MGEVVGSINGHDFECQFHMALFSYHHLSITPCENWTILLFQAIPRYIWIQLELITLNKSSFLFKSFVWDRYGFVSLLYYQFIIYFNVFNRWRLNFINKSENDFMKNLHDREILFWNCKLTYLNFIQFTSY
jgi:hypothetical protein